MSYKKRDDLFRMVSKRFVRGEVRKVTGNSI